MEIVEALMNPFNVPCECGALAGQQCINAITGRPLRRAVAHPRRLVAAQKLFNEGKVDDEDDRRGW